MKFLTLCWYIPNPDLTQLFLISLKIRNTGEGKDQNMRPSVIVKMVILTRRTVLLQHIFIVIERL